MMPDLADRIRQRLAEYLTDSAPDPLDIRSVVAKFGALPLTSDMGGCLAIRPDGKIVSFQWDEPHDAKVEQDARWRNVALYQGSLKCPELAPLVPPRPTDARPCEHCAGVAAIRAQGIKGIVCYCGGLRWLPL
ncbi:MAG: hypothetical protein ACRENE_19735 [Polyangiaceae bacterium]